MKKQYDYIVQNETYSLVDSSDQKKRFTVTGNLQFNVKELYSIVFEDIDETCEIEICEKHDANDKTAVRVLAVIRQIVDEVKKQINIDIFPIEDTEATSED